MSTIMSQIPLRMSRSVFRGITAITSKPRDLPYSTALHKDEKTPTTVDIADVKHHSKIKEQWWDPLAKLGGDVTGIDASKELVDMAKEHILDDSLRYIAVKPSASISVLRQKVWHILDLPDFCEEIIVLKSASTKINNIMLTMGNEQRASEPTAPVVYEQKVHQDYMEKESSRTTSAMTVMNKLRGNCTNNTFMPDYKKPDLSCRMSTSSLFFKLQGRKSRDNFTNILLKIQNDLSMLSNKLSNLESKIPT
ncbi:hypothetical protein MSG28_009638 [Choristoneura fumiferana]|uniref:Uncharacterized protein n=1 Tax=Choristoneura fumiferana TaxID=7141 RepID=A0ACC0JC23_CHOFU|nr:hypothetical protein MSG28_009638 [Choristoneura fumiferana]